MSIGINPVLPVTGAPTVAPDDGAFVPGTEVTGRVLQMLAANQVRLAVGAMAYDLRTTVPLEPGQVLRLAVSQGEGGIRLAVIMPDAGGGAAAGKTAGGSSVTAQLADSMMRQVQGAGTATNIAAAGLTAKLQVTPQEAVVITQVAQVAASRQGSVAQLFANLGAAATAATLPPQIQQVAAHVLMQRPQLDEKLSGKDLKAAISQSGTFLEAGISSGTGAPRGDMKAALTVLRHVLAAFAGEPDAQATKTGSTGQSTSSAMQQAALGAAARPQAGALPAGSGLPSGAGVLAQALQSQSHAQTLQILNDVASGNHENATRAQQASGDPAAQTQRPPLPPPLRGALPVAQPAVTPNLALDSGPAHVARQLLDDTEAALARQTLHQIASMPERIDQSARQDAPLRLSFEIPFALPQGTAVAQFEIAEDRDTIGPDKIEKSWQARFSIDIEPTGPVHVSIILRGEETSVRMWAERPETASALRKGTKDLAQALARADLKPGDIIVREGAPLQPPPVSSGHFLDRAS